MAPGIKPLTPSDCDLRDFPKMMLDVPRLLASEFNAISSDAEWRAGVTLWMIAFHQTPAASLPDDDVQLTRLAGFGRETKAWRKIRSGALRGWVLANDGRLYHPVVAEVALEAWLEKLFARLSSQAGNAKRYGYDFDSTATNEAIAHAAELLRSLNSKAKGLDKIKRRQSRQEHLSALDGAQAPPTGSSRGSHGESRRDRNREGEGEGGIEEKTPSQGRTIHHGGGSAGASLGVVRGGRS